MSQEGIGPRPQIQGVSVIVNFSVFIYTFFGTETKLKIILRLRHFIHKDDYLKHAD